MLCFRITYITHKGPERAQCGDRSQNVQTEAKSPATSWPLRKFCAYKKHSSDGGADVTLHRWKPVLTKWTSVNFNTCVLILNCTLALAIYIFVVLISYFDALAQENAYNQQRAGKLPRLMQGSISHRSDWDNIACCQLYTYKYTYRTVLWIQYLILFNKYTRKVSEVKTDVI